MCNTQKIHKITNDVNDENENVNIYHDIPKGIFWPEDWNCLDVIGFDGCQDLSDVFDAHKFVYIFFFNERNDKY